MQWKQSLALIAALMIGSTGALHAEMHGEEGGERTSQFQKYDTNGDGVVSMEEAKNAETQDLAENFEQYDENGNQQLDQGEFARFEAEHGKKMEEEHDGM